MTNVPGIMFRAGSRARASSRAIRSHRWRRSVRSASRSTGYDGRLYVGIDADGTAMPDVDLFVEDLEHAFDEMVWAAQATVRRARTRRRAPAVPDRGRQPPRVASE